jgi:hypothetical protein
VTAVTVEGNRFVFEHYKQIFKFLIKKRYFTAKNVMPCYLGTNGDFYTFYIVVKSSKNMLKIFQTMCVNIYKKDGDQTQNRAWTHSR